MNKTRKTALLNYLYPSSKCADFMLNDFYVELLPILAKEICFSTKNTNAEVRKENKLKAKNIVADFLERNPQYKNRLFELFGKSEINVMIDNVLIGYVMYLTPHINKFTGADVFNDKRSICYTKFSILDIIK